MAATVWGGASLTVVVGGVDVSCDVTSIDVQRGRTRMWDPPSAASAQIVINASSGGQPVSTGPVGATVFIDLGFAGRSRRLFTGTVQQQLRDSNPRETMVILDCVDGFERLGRINRRANTGDVAVGQGETVAARVDRWLTIAGWTGGRRIDPTPNMTCPAMFIDGNALQELHRTAAADGGDFLIDGDGTAVYRSWDWRNRVNTVAAIFSDRDSSGWVCYSTATYRDDLDEVQNRVPATRRPINDADDPVTQIGQDSGSISVYGQRGDPLDDLELETDGQVATRVSGLIKAAAQPSARFDPVVIQPMSNPSRAWYQCLAVGIGSLIVANRHWDDGTITSLYGHVIAERWRLTPRDASIAYRCTGTRTWDSFRPARPPLVIVVGPDGGIYIPAGYPQDTTSDVVFRDANGNEIARYPPGSLNQNADGTYGPNHNPSPLIPPEGAVEVCLEAPGQPAVCTPIPGREGPDGPVIGVLWVDVLEPGPELIERVDGDALDPGPGFGSTVVDEIAGGFDAIHANTFGGTIATSHGAGLMNANLGTGGWTVDFYYWQNAHPSAGQSQVLFDGGNIQVWVTTNYQTVGPFIYQLEVIVYTDDGVAHLSGPIFDMVTIQAWRHIVIGWSPKYPGYELGIYVDGNPV